MFLTAATIMIILLKFSLADAEFLGSTIDAAKICWSDKEIAVDNTTLPLIVYYLKSCADTLSLLHSPKSSDLSLVLSQKIHDAIPAVNKAFYEGNVDYSTVSDLHALHDNMMPCLKNSGLMNKMRNKRNWIKIRSPRSLQKQVMPLIIRANQTEKEEACNTLIVAKNTGSRIRRKVPLPFLDSVEKPKRIAVPFMSKPLYNLNDSDAKSLLVKYYITGVKCLSLSSEHNQDILVFNRNFYVWLLKCILPKIERDNKLYPAFGGVFKILDTIQDKGLVDLNREIESTIGSEICVKPSVLFKADKLVHSEPVASKKSGKVAIASSSFCIIITLVLTTFLFLTWLLIVFLFIFCRCCRYHQSKREDHLDHETDVLSNSKEKLLDETNMTADKRAIKDGTNQTPLTNEIRPVSTEFQPLITSTPERELTKIVDQNRLEYETPEKEKEKEKTKNTGFSKFLAPLKKEKSETYEEDPLILADSKSGDKECTLAKVTQSDNEHLINSSKNNKKWECSKDLSKWQCTKNRSKWQCSREKCVGGGGTNETTIKVYPKSLLLSQRAPSLTGGNHHKLDKDDTKTAKEQSTKNATMEKEGKLITSSSSLLKKSSTESMKSGEGFEVDSNYKCEIKFCGEPPKCEQCSKNFYNDVKQMMQVLQGDSAIDTSQKSDSSEEGSENQTDKTCKIREAKKCGGKNEKKK